MNQTGATGKAQQAGGWNSGAVALPQLSMAHSLTVSLFGGNDCAQRGSKAYAFTLKGWHITHWFKYCFYCPYQDEAGLDGRRY